MLQCMLFGSIKVIVSVYIHIDYITDCRFAFGDNILVFCVWQAIGCIRRPHISGGSLQL